MTDKNSAVQKILSGKLKEGFSELAEVFETDGADNNLISELQEAFFEPNLTQMMQNFDNNSKLLQDYPYIFEKHFSEPEQNRYALFLLDENLFYGYDKQEKKLLPIEVNSDRETKYFFKDLDKPLFVENEFNEFNLKFLDDNVRDSCDFAGDNHIYLWYKNADLFSLLLYYCDLNALLEHKKFVFLIGDERNKYPIDFKSEFDIDYSLNVPKEAELGDIKRIIFGWKIINCCGSIFFENILDGHPDIISNPTDMRLLAQHLNEFFVGKTVSEAISFIRRLSNDDPRKSWLLTFLSNRTPPLDDEVEGVKCIKVNKYLDELETVLRGITKPTAKEWLTALFFAYSRSRGFKYCGRINPSLFVYPHDDVYYLVGMNREQIDPLFNIAVEFPYRKVISLIRDPITQTGSAVRFMTKMWKPFIEKDGRLKTIPFNVMVFHGIMIKDLFFIKQHPLFPYMRIIRFEDLKLNPEATLSSLAEYFNIPLTTSLYKTTFAGKSIAGLGSDGSLFEGFDSKAVFNEYKDFFSVLDKYRIEMTRANEYDLYGYKPMYYDGQKLTDQEKIDIMQIPFLCESMQTIFPPEALKSARKENIIHIKNRLEIRQFPLRIYGIEGDIIPIPWLKPKEELLRVPLYTNVAEAIINRNKKEDEK